MALFDLPFPVGARRGKLVLRALREDEVDGPSMESDCVHWEITGGGETARRPGMRRLQRTGVPFQARLRDLVLFPLQVLLPWLFRG